RGAAATALQLSPLARRRAQLRLRPVRPAQDRPPAQEVPARWRVPQETDMIADDYEAIKKRLDTIQREQREGLRTMEQHAEQRHITIEQRFDRIEALLIRIARKLDARSTPSGTDCSATSRPARSSCGRSSPAHSGCGFSPTSPAGARSRRA